MNAKLETAGLRSGAAPIDHEIKQRGIGKKGVAARIWHLLGMAAKILSLDSDAIFRDPAWPYLWAGKKGE